MIKLKPEWVNKTAYAIDLMVKESAWVKEEAKYRVVNAKGEELKDAYVLKVEFASFQVHQDDPLVPIIVPPFIQFIDKEYGVVNLNFIIDMKNNIATSDQFFERREGYLKIII